MPTYAVIPAENIGLQFISILLAFIGDYTRNGLPDCL